MIERQFSDDRLAALHAVFYPPMRRDDLTFYLPLAVPAGANLDVECGAGALLRQQRKSLVTPGLCADVIRC